MVTSPLPETLLQSFGERVAERIGIAVGPPQWDALGRAIDELAPAADPMALADLSRRWRARSLQRDEVETLARHLAVGETYFFREPAAFQALERSVLPPLLAARRAEGRRLRVWSAGCCTGEEGWSLAVTLCRLLPDIADWDIRIVGTDIHAGFLEAAAQGVYGEWSFRGVPPELRHAHFVPLDGERHAVQPDIRRLVEFRHANLADDSAPDSGFDLVLCRHVLMYFEPLQAQRALQRLHDALAPGGRLLLAATEAAACTFDGFDAERHGDTVFHRKRPPVAGAQAVDASPPIERPAGAERADMALAIRQCEAAIEADKCDASLHHLHAMLLEAAGRLDDARQALRRALFLEGDFVLAHFTLARLADRQGHASLAERHFAQARRLLARLQGCGA